MAKNELATPLGDSAMDETNNAARVVLATWAAARETTGLNATPLLVDVANGDYRLQPTSTLKRAGTRGNAAFKSYTQGPALNPPDIGAYQSTGGAVAATRTVRS